MKNMKRMKRLSVITENSKSHRKHMDSFDLLGEYNFNQKKKLNILPQNILTRAKRNTGAFNDFNMNYRNKRQMVHLNKFRPTRMEGNGASGMYKHNIINHHDKLERSNIKYRIKGFNEGQFDGLNLEDTMALENAALADINGYRKVNKKDAKEQFNTYIEKTNRGGRSGGKTSGGFQGGYDFINFNNQIVRKDSKFKENIIKSDVEFRSILTGVHKVRDGIDNKNVKTY